MMGVPVTAYPVAGPLDVIGGAPVGCLDEDLAAAVAKAQTLSPDACREHALRFSWRRSAEQFLGNLVPAYEGSAAPRPTPPNNSDSPRRPVRGSIPI